MIIASLIREDILRWVYSGYLASKIPDMDTLSTNSIELSSAFVIVLKINNCIAALNGSFYTRLYLNSMIKSEGGRP